MNMAWHWCSPEVGVSEDPAEGHTAARGLLPTDGLQLGGETSSIERARQPVETVTLRTQTATDVDSGCSHCTQLLASFSGRVSIRTAALVVWASNSLAR